MAWRLSKRTRKIKNRILNFKDSINIQYFAALHYIEEKYGVGALEHIKTKKYTSAGSPLNAIEFITYLKNKKIIKNPNYSNVTIKNDSLDLVANVIGFNGDSIIDRDAILREKIENKEKYGIKYNLWEPHNYYSKGNEPNSYINYRKWQKPLIYSDKILRIFNPKTYFNKEEKIEINKGAKRNEEIK